MFKHTYVQSGGIRNGRTRTINKYSCNCGRPKYREATVCFHCRRHLAKKVHDNKVSFVAALRGCGWSAERIGQSLKLSRKGADWYVGAAFKRYGDLLGMTMHARKLGFFEEIEIQNYGSEVTDAWIC